MFLLYRFPYFPACLLNLYILSAWMHFSKQLWHNFHFDPLLSFTFWWSCSCSGSKQLKECKLNADSIPLHIPRTHLCLFERAADFLHERSVVSPLHSELFVFKTEAAAAGLAFPVHCAVCETVNVHFIAV